MGVDDPNGGSTTRDDNAPPEGLALEVPARAEFDESWLDDRQRQLPGLAEVVQLRENRVRIERVVEVDVEIDAALADRDDLGEPQVELIEPVAIDGAGLDQIDARLRQRKGPPQRRLRQPGGVVVDVVRPDLRPRQALIRAADTDAVPGQRV